MPPKVDLETLAAKRDNSMRSLYELFEEFQVVISQKPALEQIEKVYKEIESKYRAFNSFSPQPFASYYDTFFSNKISRRVFTPLLNKSHHCNPHKITFQTGGQVPSEHYTKRNNHIFTHRLAKDSKFHIHKILNIS